MHKNSRCPKSSDTMKVSPRNFLALWDNKLWKNRDALLLCNKHFGTTYFFETQKGFRTNFFGTVIHSSVTSFLGVLRHKEFFDRTVMSPTPPPCAFLCMTIFDTRSSLNYRCVPLRDLWLVLKKNSTVNGEILFWCTKISIPEFFRNTERLNGYTTKFVGTMRHKKNRKNPWCSPALVCEKFFDTRFSSNQRKALIRFSTALWEEKLSTKNRHTPILCMKFIW